VKKLRQETAVRIQTIFQSSTFETAGETDYEREKKELADYPF
jgi:hypothetical protein